MKKLIIIAAITLGLGCSESGQQKVDTAIDRTGDSLKSKLNKLNDTLRNAADRAANNIPKVEVNVKKHAPITLQWLGTTPGDVELTKLDDGYFAITGEQTNTAHEFVKIEGKIKRLDASKLEFIGTIITYVKINNGGKPCEKTGTQTFLKKDKRDYYRLQQMENCEKGKVLDYVDLYRLDGLL